MHTGHATVVLRLFLLTAYPRALVATNEFRILRTGPDDNNTLPVEFHSPYTVSNEQRKLATYSSRRKYEGNGASFLQLVT